ncbi:MAG: aminotransferase class V-fold PLP-dependent enzyme [Acidobacteriaceae bacterium]|nr:aminotransferase class V-fold PLP-dependent enzyme [Acidobacteriaceae bacterium]
MSTDFDAEAVRSRFPIFKKKIFLNSCSQGALSDAVEASLREHIRVWHEQGSPWDCWVQQYEGARAAFARFIGATPDEVAVITSASAGINSVASALDFNERRKVIMGEFEFPTMGQIWLAQERRGAKIHFLPAEHGKICPDSYAKAIDDQTLIVPVTQVCFSNGFRSDVGPIVKTAHEHGALVMLDGYQDCGTRPINVKELDVDFYVTGALKYLLCPSGIAFLYVRPEIIHSLNPTITGWFAQENPFAFDVKHLKPAATARRFETGSPPLPHVYAVPAALQLMGAVGFEKISEHIARLTRALMAGAHDLKIRIKTPADSVGPLVVLQMKDADAMVKKLAERDVVASNRMDGLRVSFHLYNTLEDVNAVLEVLQDNLSLAVQNTSASWIR